MSREVSDQPDDRSPADAGYERAARELFPIREMSPERYVALPWGRLVGRRDLHRQVR